MDISIKLTDKGYRYLKSLLEDKRLDLIDSLKESIRDNDNNTVSEVIDDLKTVQEIIDNF